MSSVDCLYWQLGAYETRTADICELVGREEFWVIHLRLNTYNSLSYSGIQSGDDPAMNATLALGEH